MAIAFDAAGTPATGTTALTVVIPAGATLGSVMVLSVVSTAGAASNVTGTTGNTGWQIRDTATDAGGAPEPTVTVLWKLCGSGDAGASVTCTFAATPATTVGVVNTYTGVDPATPFEASAAAFDATGGGTAHVSPTIVTTQDTDWILTAFGDRSGSTWTPPAGFTERSDTSSGAVASMETADSNGTVAHGSISETATATTSTSTDVMWIGALQVPAAAAAGGGAVQAQPGKTWLRRFHHRQQQLPPAVTVVVPVTATPQPVVIATPNASQWFSSNQPIISLAPQQPVVTPTVTPVPVVVNEPNASQWFSTPSTIVSAAPPTPQPPARPTVVNASPASQWFNANSPQTSRSSLQDAIVSTATPQPVVETSQPDSRYTKTGTAQVIQAPQAPTVVAQATPQPVVQNEPNAQQWYDVKPAQDFRNTTQDPPVLTTSSPTVVTSQPPQSWLRPNPTKIIRNPILLVVPTATPAPIVVGSKDTQLFRVTRPQVIRNPLPVIGPAVQTPICYSGTVTDQNLFHGSIVRLPFSGSIVDGNVFGGMVVDSNAFAGTVVHVQVFGGGMVRQILDGGLVGWCMQEVDITLAEFNDESLTVTITSGGGPFNVTGLTMEMYLKANAGDSDTAPSTVKLTTPTDITIVDGPNGIVNVAIPNADLQPGDVVGFYRYDILQSGKRHTALYGKVGVTQL